MRSSIVAIVVFVLGLSATAYSAQQCDIKCHTVSNGTSDNGVQIQYGADITITVSKVDNVIVFVNQKTKVVIAIDFKSNLVLIYRTDASFGIIFDTKTGGCVKVQLDINLVVEGDFTELRKAFDKAKEEIKGGGSTVVVIDFTFVQQASFNFNAVFVRGSAETISQIKVTYSAVFETSFNAVVVIGRDTNFVGALIVVVFERASDVVVGFAQSISLVVNQGVNISYKFAIFLATSIQQGASTVFVTFQASFKASQGELDKAVDEVKNGVHIERSVTVGSFEYHFLVVLVRDYLEFALTLGNIKIDIGYSGKALAVFNNKANIVLVVNGKYYFIYSYELKAGFLFYESNFVYVTSDTIKEKNEKKTEINSGTLAFFVSAHGKQVFESSKKIAIKDLKAALESQSKTEEFCNANGIANGAVVYKVFANFKNSISGNFITGYSLSLSGSLRVSFSLTASYTIDNSVYNNLIVSGIATALEVATKFTSAATIFASLKIVIGTN